MKILQRGPQLFFVKSQNPQSSQKQDLVVFVIRIKLLNILGPTEILNNLGSWIKSKMSTLQKVVNVLLSELFSNVSGLEMDFY